MITKKTILLKDLYVNEENFMEAFDKTGDFPASYSTGKPLQVCEKDNKFYLWDGHHRVADEVNKHNDLDEILILEFEAKVYGEEGFPEAFEKKLSALKSL